MLRKTLAATAAGLLAVSLGVGTASAQSADAPEQAATSSATGSLQSGPLFDLLTEQHESAPQENPYFCGKAQRHDKTTAPWKLEVSECEENADGEYFYTWREVKEEFKFLEGLITGA